MTRLQPVVARLKRGAVAGIAGGAVYAVVMAADLRLTGRNVNDAELLGRFVVDSPAAARRLGLVLHLANAAALGGLYGLIASRLPGPPWVRGIIFANAENCLLYPLARLEAHHPGIRDGSLDRYWTWAAFLQSTPRHIAYGAVVGALYSRLQAASPAADGVPAS